MLKKVTIYHVGNAGFIAFIVACTVTRRGYGFDIGYQIQLIID